MSRDAKWNWIVLAIIVMVTAICFIGFKIYQNNQAADQQIEQLLQELNSPKMPQGYVYNPDDFISIDFDVDSNVYVNQNNTSEKVSA